VLAGLVLAMAVVIKPYPVIFLPYLLLKRRFVTFGVFLALVILSLLLPAVIYGAEGNRLLLESWVQTLSQSTRANLLNQDNVSIWAMYARWFGVGALASGLALATLLAIAAGVLVLLQLGSERPGVEYLEMALLLMLIPLVSPQGWDYQLLMATPAVMLLVNEFRGLPLAMRLVSGAAMATMALLLLLEESGWRATLWGNFRHDAAVLAWADASDEDLFATVLIGRDDGADVASTSLERGVMSRTNRVRRVKR